MEGLGNMNTDSTLEDMHIVTLKTLRRDLDEKVQKMKDLPYGTSEETAEAVKKVKEGIMWLGMELKRMNELGFGANPYPNSKDPSNTKIDPTADGLKL